MLVKIYTMTHKKFDVPNDPMYVPLQVGAEGKEPLGYVRDNTGENRILSVSAITDGIC